MVSEGKVVMLAKGQVGTVVLVYGEQAGYMVEFMDGYWTIALVDLGPDEIEPIRTT
jgi:hypothetical protein